MIELTGSEKQVSWALKIREQKLVLLEKKVASEINYLKNSGMSSFVKDAAIERLNRNMSIIREKSEAKWWIENRDSLSLSQLKSEDIK